MFIRLLLLAALTTISFNSFAIENKNIRINSDLTKSMWNSGLESSDSVDVQNYEKYLNFVDKFEKKFIDRTQSYSPELKKALSALN